MPEPKNDKGQKKIENESALRNTVAAERNVNVLTDKPSEGHMPPSPEF